MKYRNINSYKYELMEPLLTEIPGLHGYISTAFIHLDDEILRVEKGYCWDGASGPTIDTKSTIRGSLVHDALYQLMRMGLLQQSYKPLADQTFRRLILEDGMGKFRAWYYYNGVRFFGKGSAKVQQREPKVIEI